MYLLFDIGGTKTRLSLSPDAKKLIKTEVILTPRNFSKGIDAIYTFTKDVKIIKASDAIKLNHDVVLMSARAPASMEWAPKFVNAGAVVIDNSSAWRINDDVELAVYGVSKLHSGRNSRIISNPNCVAIMVATAIAPLVRFGIKHISVTAMQAISGMGKAALDEFKKEVDIYSKGYYSPVPSRFFNQIGPASIRGLKPNSNQEEDKGNMEIQKIFGDKFLTSFRSLRASVEHGHVADVRITLRKDVSIPEVIEALENGSNIRLYHDDVPLSHALDQDKCIVWGVRVGSDDFKTIELVAMSDNLRLGAASNAVSIMEQIFS